MYNNFFGNTGEFEYNEGRNKWREDFERDCYGEDYFEEDGYDEDDFEEDDGYDENSFYDEDDYNEDCFEDNDYFEEELSKDELKELGFDDFDDIPIFVNNYADDDIIFLYKFCDIMGIVGDNLKEHMQYKRIISRENTESELAKSIIEAGYLYNENMGTFFRKALKLLDLDWKSFVAAINELCLYDEYEIKSSILYHKLSQLCHTKQMENFLIRCFQDMKLIVEL